MQMNRAAIERLEKGDHEGALENFSKAWDCFPKNKSRQGQDCITTKGLSRRG